jgi:hypothetical protein
VGVTDLIDEGAVDSARIPYRGAQPADAFPELVIPHAIPEDERLWTPQQENVWFRPLCLSARRRARRIRSSWTKASPRYVDPDGAVQAYEDVFTKIDMCRKHYAKVGLGEDYVKQFIR